MYENEIFKFAAKAYTYVPFFILKSNMSSFVRFPLFNECLCYVANLEELVFRFKFDK